MEQKLIARVNGHSMIIGRSWITPLWWTRIETSGGRVDVLFSSDDKVEASLAQTATAAPFTIVQERTPNNGGLVRR